MASSSVEIEASLLGLALSRPEEVLPKIIDIIRPDDFSEARNQKLFQGIQELYHNERLFDYALLLDELRKSKIIDEVGMEYIVELVDSAGYLTSVDNYIDKLLEYAQLREIRNKTVEIVTKIDKDNLTSQQAIDELQNDIFNMGRIKEAKGFVESGPLIEEVLTKIFQRKSSKSTITGLNTGFTEINKITLGLHKGDLIILAARPAMGKTAFAVHLAKNVAATHSVAFFSYEMPAEQLMMRTVSIVTQITGYDLKSPHALSSQDEDKLMRVRGTIEKMKLYIDDSSSSTIANIAIKCKRLKESKGLDLVIIDYLQLIPSTTSLGDNRQLEVSKISRALKQMARELEVPVIALSQLSRRVEQREDKTPILSDLRESGSIEQDADIVAFLHREDYYNKGRGEGDNEEQPSDVQLVEFIIAKHRNGAIGKVKLGLKLATGSFINYEN